METIETTPSAESRGTMRVGAGRRLVQGCWLAAVLVSACQASVQAEAHLDAKASADGTVNDFDRPLEAPQLTSDSPDDFAIEEYALLGARHDLSYAGPKEPACKCLAVSLHDQANHESFQWELGAPRLEPATQWVIALTSNEVACPAPPQGTLGASYQGYVVEGNDVIVFVEALGEGRPMTNGAVIPRPLGSGSVFVEAAGAIYGKPLKGKGKRCRIAPPPMASAAR